MKRTLLAATLTCVLAVAGLSAQQGTGELRGRVLDTQSAVLPGVTVVAKNEASGQFREVVSGADGSFFMSALTPGSYEVGAQLSGFKRYQREGASASKSGRRSRSTCSSKSAASSRR